MVGNNVDILIIEYYNKNIHNAIMIFKLELQLIGNLELKLHK